MQRTKDDGRQQLELSAEGTNRDVENTPKCTCPNCILARQWSLGPAQGLVDQKTFFGYLQYFTCPYQIRLKSIISNTNFQKKAAQTGFSCFFSSSNRIYLHCISHRTDKQSCNFLRHQIFHRGAITQTKRVEDAILGYFKIFTIK